jgi:hypothetical protein
MQLHGRLIPGLEDGNLKVDQPERHPQGFVGSIGVLLSWIFGFDGFHGKRRGAIFDADANLNSSALHLDRLDGGLLIVFHSIFVQIHRGCDFLDVGDPVGV